MLYSNILSKDELEALLAPKELEVFIAEQKSRLEHELTLSPAHLLLALRELEDTVERLTARVMQLENQLTVKPQQLVPEITELEEIAITENYIETHIEPDIEHQMEPTVVEEIENSEVSESERSILLAKDTETSVEVNQIPEASAYAFPSPQESSLISRSARHRERKPSLISKLLK
jgi:hypothetical protein